MVGATGIFVLLSIFYYEYVPEGAYDEGPVLEILKKKIEILISRILFSTSQDLDEKSSISSNSSDDEDEKKMKEISKAEEAGINDNNGNENEAFEEESF